MTTPSSMAASLFNTIPNNCVMENSLLLSGFGIGLSTGRPWFESGPDLIIFVMHLFISFFVTNFVRKRIIKLEISVDDEIDVAQMADFAL